MSNKEKKLNLYNYEFRVLPHSVPENAVLLQENLFGTKAYVKDRGLRFTLGRGQAREIEKETFDFNEQKIDGSNLVDIYMDFSVDYQIGARLNENELESIYNDRKYSAVFDDKYKSSSVINSVNKDARRVKIFKLFLRTENDLAVSMEQILMSIVREKLTGMPFEKVQFINSRDDIFKEIKNEYFAKCLDLLGVEVIDLRISRIRLSDKVNELYNEKRIATEEAEIKKIKAKGDRDAEIIKAKAEKEAEIIKAQAEAEKIKLTEGAKNEMDKKRMENFKGQDYKTILSTTSPENMNKVSEKTVKWEASGNSAATIGAIINSIKELVNVTPTETVAPVVTEQPAEEIFTNPVEENKVGEDFLANTDFFDDKKEEKNTIESINDYKEVVPEENTVVEEATPVEAKTTEEMIVDLQNKDPELLAKAIDSVIAEENNEAEITENDFNFEGTMNVEEIKDEEENGFQKSLGNNNNI